MILLLELHAHSQIMIYSGKFKYKWHNVKATHDPLPLPKKGGINEHTSETLRHQEPKVTG